MKTATSQPPADRDSSEPSATLRALVDALGQTGFVVMGALTRIAAEHDLSLTQLRVLGILRDRRLRITHLADFLGLDKSTMSGLIDRAERRDLVTRTRSSEDGRAVEVSMTPAGHELADELQADVYRALAPMISRLDARQQRSLTETLQTALTSP